MGRYFEDRGSFDLQDYIHAHGDPRQALLLFGLFFPELTEVAGHVVLVRYERALIHAEVGGPIWRRVVVSWLRDDMLEFDRERV